MNFLKKLKVRAKLLTLIGFMLVAVVGMGVYNLIITAQVADGGREIYENNLQSVSHAEAARAAFLNASISVYQHIVADTQQRMDEFENAAYSKVEEVNHELELSRGLAKTEQGIKLIDLAKQNAQQYAEYLPEVFALSRELRTNEARAIANNEMREFQLGALDALNELSELNKQQADAQNGVNEELFASSRNSSITILFIISVISLGFGLWIARIIVNPIKKVHQVAEALADGDLSLTADVDSTDEIGLMAGAVNRAITNLRNLVGKVAETSELVASSSQQLSASAEEVGNATQQVAETINQ